MQKRKARLWLQKDAGVVFWERADGESFHSANGKREIRRGVRKLPLSLTHESKTKQQCASSRGLSDSEVGVFGSVAMEECL